MQELSRRNEHFTDSVIRRMTRISIDCGAINLAQGFPDFDPPKAMTDRLEEVSRLGPHQYPITMGAPNFRQALSRKCERFMGMKYDPETEMVVTIGSTEAMVDTIFTLTNPGDKIVMFSPYFENYRAQTIMAGCEPVFVPARSAGVRLRSGGAGGRLPSASQGNFDLQPLEPERQGLYLRRAQAHRGSLHPI